MLTNAELFKTSGERNEAYSDFCKRYGNDFVTQFEWLEISNKQIRKVYDGKKMRLFGWTYPVVIDLKGVKTTGWRVPVLVVNVAFDGAESLREAEYAKVAVSDDGIYIITDRKAPCNGYSIACKVEASELINTGTREINGRTHEAPFYHVTASVLTEVAEQPDNSQNDLLELSVSNRNSSNERFNELERINSDQAKEIEKLKQQVCEFRKTNERLLLDLGKLVEAARPFCHRHQWFEELKESVNNAAHDLDDATKDDPF